jgi:hypothetical protein
MSLLWAIAAHTSKRQPGQRARWPLKRQTMSKLHQIVLTLTLAQAQEWQALTDKWVFIDDTILAANDLRANNYTIGAIESAFETLLAQN